MQHTLFTYLSIYLFKWLMEQEGDYIFVRGNFMFIFAIEKEICNDVFRLFALLLGEPSLIRSLFCILLSLMLTLQRTWEQLWNLK